MKLHELHINNFKFFPNQKTDSPLLKIDGKNLLIYGENGSGKSTIFWALYTLFENAFKINEFEVEKYFIKSSVFSLVNIYARSNQITNIKIILKDGVNEVEYEVNKNIHQIVSNLGNSNLREIGMASDFINYRVIFRLHQIKHSKENDLFSWFRDEIFPYILIADINSTKSVDAVYKEISRGPVKVKSFDRVDTLIYPNQSMSASQEELVKKQYIKYKRYSASVKKWNKKLETYLNKLYKRANEIIRDDFKLDFEIKLIYTSSSMTITEDTFKWVEPKVELKITKYNNRRNVVKKPHSFLNEAKWTSIALALRFAIIEDWTNRPSQAQLKILVIDDMLLSLDMGNRDAVLNILLDRVVNDYQLILMTHDRHFFEVAKSKINAVNQGGNWIKLEMYEDEIGNKKEPLILKSKTNLEKAKVFYKQKEFAASANHLRKATEHFVKEYVPKQHQYDRSYSSLNLSQLIDKSRAVARQNGLPRTIIQDLDIMRSHMFNPGSHYDVYTSLYQTELVKAIKTLEEVSSLTNITI